MGVGRWCELQAATTILAMSDLGRRSHGTAVAIEPVVVKKNEHENDVIGIYRLEQNGVKVDVCELGASIVHILLPRPQNDDTGDNDVDVVLRFDSIEDMYHSHNPAYVGVIAGRVANRVRDGRFQTERNGKIYQLEINDSPNHLHGGRNGFSTRIWESKIVPDDIGDQVEFFYLSKDGEEGYPGTIRVSATYSLQTTANSHVVKLCLSMKAELLNDIPSPINLTQHSYFNLAGHNAVAGILDHSLRLFCDAYTPVDSTSIPTREVRSLDNDPVMDWRYARTLRGALTDYGVSRANRSREQVLDDLNLSGDPLSNSSDDTCPPYGFDHNYIVRRSSLRDGLSLVAVLQCEDRRLTICSTQPGLQLYTANYLDGNFTKKRKDGKDSALSYPRWQALCLETQHFPDSISVDDGCHPRFASGKCPILTPSTPTYEQVVEYTVENNSFQSKDTLSMAGFQGTDSEGNHFYSVDEMWEGQGVVEGDSTSWYARATSFYKDNCPSTVDGVLGGFASISEPDLIGSKEFINELESVRPEVRMWTRGDSAAATTDGSTKLRACECGAGLGRVTKNLLLRLGGIDNCDLVDSSAALLAAAPEYLGDAAASQCRYFCTGLENWTPSANTYTIIWIQWVLSYLTDEDIVSFLRRCGESLTESGVIILKENICEESDFEVDAEDASVTRSLRYWKVLIQRSGMRVFHEKLPESLVEDIYPVPLLALEVSKQPHFS